MKYVGMAILILFVVAVAGAVGGVLYGIIQLIRAGIEGEDI